MSTQYISFSEARKNLSSLWKKAKKENIKYVVLVHSQPAFEITPTQEDENSWDTQFTEKNRKAYKIAMEELKNGETISYEEISQKYG